MCTADALIGIFSNAVRMSASVNCGFGVLSLGQNRVSPVVVPLAV
jgi:hypothetical protein